MSGDSVLEQVVPMTPRVRAATELRARLLAMTQASHDAALLPAEPGGLLPGTRAGIAARIARLCGDAALAAHYDGLAAQAGGVPDWAEPGTAAGEAKLDAAIAYADRVTRTPAQMEAPDIAALRTAGWQDGDIVRLAGLAAFVNYQLRVAAVLRAMGAAA